VSWLKVFKVLMALVEFVMKRIDKAEVERAFADAIVRVHGERVEGAIRAGDDVRAGRVPLDPNDPNRRD